MSVEVATRGICIGRARNYFHTMTETLTALHWHLDRRGELGRLDCRLHYTGPRADLLSYFSRQPVEPLPDPAPEMFDTRQSGGMRRLVLVRDFLSARVPWDRQQPGITVVHRPGMRTFDQHDELVAALHRFGLPVRVAVFETLSFEEQVNVARNTRLLIGPHGAGETNMIFMPPGGVIELNPKGFGIATYERMADSFGHGWRALEAVEHGRRCGYRPGAPVIEYIDQHGWPTPEQLATAPAEVRRELRRIVRDVRSFPLDVDRVMDTVDDLLAV